MSTGLDYPAKLAAERRAKAQADAARARREGAASRLEPPFPYAAIPFDPETFGAIPDDLRERETEATE